METESRQAELNNTSLFILLMFRVGVLLFSVLLTLKTDIRAYRYIDIILLGLAIYQFLTFCIYWPAMKLNITRLLLCASDLLIGYTLVLLTGGISSPFIPCVFIPIFTLHFVYGWKGLAGGLAGLALSTAVSALTAKAAFYASGGESRAGMIVSGISLILFYLVPFLCFSQYCRLDSQLLSQKKRYNELDSMNSKLLVLYEMTGRFNYENGIAQVMDKLLALCGEVFPAQRICIFLIRSGEVEIYGRPSPQEKEEIYRLILEQKKTAAINEENEYIIRDDALVIPLIRGARTDGVLSFSGWNQKEITDREAIMLSMIANMVCTYLENLEYVEYLKNKALPDTSVILNQLDSGKPVKGILDKRIVSPN
ncbi:MAG TPA: hypothetical protein GXZ37_03720 [Clostridiales bacterium]|nr:hypothetical protein [Clostridiales bacterium]